MSFSSENISFHGASGAIGNIFTKHSLDKYLNAVSFVFSRSDRYSIDWTCECYITETVVFAEKKLLEVLENRCSEQTGEWILWDGNEVLL